MTAPEVKVTQRAEEVAEEIVSTANIVTNGGYYEIDIDAVSAVVARFEAEVRATATTPLEARIAALEGAMGEAVGALRKVDRMNDHPGWFRRELDEIVMPTLASLTAMLEGGK